MGSGGCGTRLTRGVLPQRRTNVPNERKPRFDVEVDTSQLCHRQDVACRTLACWRGLSCGRQGTESQSQRSACMSVLSRIDSIPKGVSGVCVSGFSLPRTCLHTYVHQYEQALRDSLDRFRRGGLTVSPLQIDGNITIVSARAQDKHARVADGICRLIWNMRCKRRAFSTRPNGRIRNIRNSHPRQSHHPSHFASHRRGEESPYKLPIKIPIPTAWMANGRVSAARNLSTGRNTVGLSELAISAPAVLGH